MRKEKGASGYLLVKDQGGFLVLKQACGGEIPDELKQRWTSLTVAERAIRTYLNRKMEETK